MSSIDKLLEKFPYFLNKSTGSNFYKSEWVFNEWFKEVYNDLFLTYCSQKLSKPLLVWKVQNEPYKYNMCFAVVLNNLKTVIIYQNDVIVYREDYGPEDNQNSFYYVLNGVCEDNIIPDDSFLLYVESYDEYVLCKGFPENDENDYISINETVFEDLSVELKINTSVPDVANVCVMKGSDVVYTNTDNIDETFKINEPTLYDSYYVKVTTSNPLIYYEKRWSKLDSYSHDSSLDELGVFYSMPRKTYTYTHHKKWYNTYYASTEPPYNNRYTEDDYHYMNRIITYTTLYHTTPLPILELWKLFGITATIKNRKDILCKMYEKSLHDPNWKPDDDYSHKNLMYVEPESNVKMLIVTVDNSSPYYGMPVYFNLTLYDEHFNTLELKGYVEVYERTNDNNTLIDTIQVNNWVLDTNNLNNGIHAYTFKYYEDDVFICESDELFITLKGCDDVDIYISTDGDDNNDGSKNKPVKSFEKAVNLVESNKSFIFVGAGDYYLKNTLNINKSCTITHCQKGEVNIHSPTKVIFNILPDTVLNLVNVNCWFRDFVYPAVMDTHSNNSKTGIISGVTVNTGNTKKDTVLTCTADKTSVTVGETVTLTATVKSDGVNVNEGQVDFGDGVLVDVSNGTAVKTFTKQTPTVLTLTPSYKGTSTYTTATASLLTLTWVEEQVTPEISISASTLIGEVGDDLPITLSSNLKNTALTVLLNDAEVVDSVTTDNTGNAVFNYNCNGTGDVNVKVKYLSGTNVYYSNILQVEDCIKYGFKDSDTWVNPTGHSATNNVVDGVFTSTSNSSKGDSILSLDLSGDFIITYDAQWQASTRCGIGAKDTTRTQHFDSGTDTNGANQKYVSYNGSNKTDKIYKNSNIAEYVNCKIIKQNNTLTGYMNNTEVVSVDYGWISQCTVWNFHTTIWNSDKTLKIKNLKIKPSIK